MRFETDDSRQQLFRLIMGYDPDDSAAHEAYFAGCYDASTLYEYQITKLRHENEVKSRYIKALEEQLEPSVIEEIRTELSALEKETK
jgi:hypothetical protein